MQKQFSTIYTAKSWLARNNFELASSIYGAERFERRLPEKDKVLNHLKFLCKETAFLIQSKNIWILHITRSYDNVEVVIK